MESFTASPCMVLSNQDLDFMGLTQPTIPGKMQKTNVCILDVAITWT